ncbi:unnamed protein product [Medioppia subpectinata]|uniref:Serine/threonine-protein kinase RIO2 n=1 Tax=Medioppia subpectinata TaxID=1979941 RepID=A0A7R9L650_9ACAR|nr:unnamed protein product [Medioppia subpectinata]CAG2116046.1 unnamed protein product [Medioppia subpectinata]
MVKLDVSLIRYMSADELRVLTSVEMGMKNHELVPKSLIISISSLRSGGLSKVLLKLTQNKLISYERGKRFDGYHLTYKGYDFLALNVLSNREVIAGIGNQIGVGKESDVYVATDREDRTRAVKMHRLGRTCFRTVSTKRDYQRNGRKTNWIYLSRLAAKREFAFMKLLYDNHVSIPEPIESNRHCIVMELIDGVLLNHVSRDHFQSETEVPALYDKLMNLIIRLANDFGVIHGDFNEFNIIVKHESSEPVLIDFPQMISISHTMAQIYFDRDVKCIVDFFAKRFAYESDFIPGFEAIEKENVDKLNELSLLDEEETSDEDEEEEDEEVVKEDNEVLSEPKVNEILTDISEDNQNDTEKQLTENIDKLDIKETTNTNNLSDSNEDNESNGSFGGATSVATTFTPQEIKEKLRKERNRTDKRAKTRKAKKDIKGDNCAFIRRRKDDLATLRDDMKAYNVEKEIY